MMSGDSEENFTIKDINDSLETPSGINPIIIEMHSQNDRGAAITGAVFLEQKLRDTIAEHWPPMSNTMQDRIFKGYGPLASFSALIDVATAMGILHVDTRSDFLAIKRIRNAAAHTGTPFSFTDESLKSQLRILPVQNEEMFDKHGETPERNQFTVTIKILAMYLHLAGYMRRKHGNNFVVPRMLFAKKTLQNMVALDSKATPA